MKQKTNSMRLLEARKIPYEAHEFSPEIRSAEDAAQVLHVPANQVYKTLVVIRERGRPLLVMVPGNKSLDLKLLAKQVGEKKLRMATHREAEALTGLEVGGISALSLLNKGFEIYADAEITTLCKVYISAGCRGINLGLHPSDLLQVTQARLVKLTALQEEQGGNP
ncbi:MAG: YbaK/EbsC family protein [Anaerolineae bacterium]